MILIIRTDNPLAELGIYDDNNKELVHIKWEAGRALSAQIHQKIEEIFLKSGIGYRELTGLVLYKGPGSFTGLRIGASVANTLASELDIPIAGSSGKGWLLNGLGILRSNPDQRSVEIDYGSPPNTTKPKK